MNRKRGKRGKRKHLAMYRFQAVTPLHRVDNTPDVSCKQVYIAEMAGTATARLEDDAIYFECSDVEESVQDHVIPRRSVTYSQMLKYGDLPVEVEPIKTRQLDKKTGNMITTFDNRVTWRGDRTLLDRTKPTQHIGTFKYEGAITQGLNRRKYIRTEKEVPFTEETIRYAAEEGDL